MSRGSSLYLSPSEYHGHLIRTVRPSLQFDGGDVGRWQKRLRRKLKSCMGYHPPRDRVDLNVRHLWTHDHKLGTIEKVAFTAEPHSDVLAYVCLPANAEPPYPVMICLQGHTSGMHVSIAVQRDDETKPRPSSGDRAFAIDCMERGVAALCIEQRSFGLRREQKQELVSEHGCHDAAMHALMLGKTLLGERVFDVDRGIDYLASRGDMDLRRVGCMGNSGGGTVTTYAAAVLPRLRAAMPSCSFCTFAESYMSIFHCADNYVPGLLQYAEMADVAGLFAPKPLVIVAGKTDPIFPIKGVRKAYRDLKAIYRAAGNENGCRLVVGPQGHRFYAKQGWAAMQKLL